ncbi:hypothetical protein E4U43_001027 [Claviceps pusilla]|uniref:Uncharacterized protein n=1 Tax=Claviceps pusilla TaxID=123648 RepID=A0A9P7NAY2_9HYPO|nr:hypothetical protein E4U43_001027 [Claviceps pusilla]
MQHDTTRTAPIENGPMAAGIMHSATWEHIYPEERPCPGFLRIYLYVHDAELASSLPRALFDHGRFGADGNQAGPTIQQ